MSKRAQQKHEIVVISDDEDEPKAKKKEKKPRAPPAEVVELKEKVAKLEKDFEGALRYARQYELEKEEKQQRVEFLENLLDQKPVFDGTDKKLIEELQNKLAEVFFQLEETNKKAAIKAKEHWKKVKSLSDSSEAEKQEAASREAKLQEGLDAMTKKLHEERALATEDRKRDRAWLSDLSSHLEESAGKEEKAATKEFEAAQEINALKLEIVALKRTICSMHDNCPELQERVSALTKELEEEQQRARDKQAIDCIRIDELSDKVAKYEMVLQQVQQVVPPPPMLLTPIGIDVTTTEDKCGLQECQKIHESSQSTNLFQRCATGTLEAISFESAAMQLRKMWSNGGKDDFKQYYRGTGEQLKCEECELTIDNADVIAHFLSSAHCEKMCSVGGAAVSFDAFQHWVQQLQLASTAAVTSTHAARAASVPSVQSQLLNDVQMMIKGSSSI